MKAIIVKEYGNPEVLIYTDTDIPEIGPSQVLIRVEKTSVNFADIKTRYGKKGSKKLPYIPGLDTAGVIVKTGRDVRKFKEGQRVIAFPFTGSYAEYAAAEENLTFALPENIDFDTAAACPTVSFLAYKLICDIAKIQKGENVLIHSAAGGAGTAAIQLAKILGAGKVIGTVGNESKAKTALEAGADMVICYEREHFAEKVNDATNGKGADIILDSIAGRVTEKSLSCLAPYGRLVQYGNSGGKAGSFQTSDLHSSCRSVLGFSLGTTRKLRPEILEETAGHVLRYLSEGSLKMKIGRRFALEDAHLAHGLMESRLSEGKILLDMRK
ncbi:zinc-binding dehydrogenase [Bacillus sp. MUM 13]|uniref:quinone oxidoreductase family protein n=1 Tax=Bacillus sp. MUM 13 TaxID=1678001 RepID=UPI0008F5F61F|nr:zinc-binding dehydrogenase [Bacillus sp. MUM 13]OIK13747.1 quinone oxidoreductase [Bacillus sp. MUM 13]